MMAVSVHDAGIKLSLNKVFNENFQRGGRSEKFEIAVRKSARAHTTGNTTAARKPGSFGDRTISPPW